MIAQEILIGHVTFKLRYNQIYQLKTTKVKYLPIWINCITTEGINLQRQKMTPFDLATVLIRRFSLFPKVLIAWK